MTFVAQSTKRGCIVTALSIKDFTMYDIIKGLIFFFNSYLLNFITVKRKNKENGGNSYT